MKAWGEALRKAGAGMKPTDISGIFIDKNRRTILLQKSSIAAHEYGHLLWLETAGSELQEEVRKFFDEGIEYPSEYGKTNVKEYFAEHFDLYCRGKVLEKNFPEYAYEKNYPKMAVIMNKFVESLIQQEEKSKAEDSDEGVIVIVDGEKKSEELLLSEEEADEFMSIVTAEEKQPSEVEIAITDVLKQRSFLVYDTNLALEQALGLAKAGNKVYYFLEYRTTYPKIEDYISGFGFDSIEKIDDYATVLDDVDVIMFTDVGFGSLADYLRGEGKNVFGASKIGERLEIDRRFLIEEFEKLGIGLPKYKILKGVSGLVDYIKANEGGGKRFWVKLNKFRGNMETCSCTNAEEIKVLIGQSGFGILGEELEFIVTEEVSGVEIGIDTFFNGKEFLRPYHLGDEVKDAGTKGKWVKDSLWDELLLEKLQPWLAKAGYRGAFSMEAIYDGSDIHCLDATCRLPYPPSCVFTKNLDNWGDIVEAVAKGENVDVKPRYLYDVEITLDAAEYLNKWRQIYVDDDVADKVGFKRTVFVNGGYWFVPSDVVLASAVGVGNTFEESLSDAEEVAKGIYAFGVTWEMGLKKKFDDVNEKLKRFGIEW
jgi:hypothetical protein